MPRRFPRFARDLYPVWRFARGYRRFAREHTDSASALARVRERLARREERFLQLARERVFGYPRSPYLPLLRSAGCGFADLRSMNPNYLNAWVHLAKLHGINSDFDAAYRCLDRAEEIDPEETGIISIRRAIEDLAAEC